MAEVSSRQNDPGPDIDFQEVYLPNDQDYGTGVFRFQVKEKTLTGRGKITATAVHAPHFQISAALNLGRKEVPVDLGKFDGSDPMARNVFLLPVNINLMKSHEFIVTFKNWRLVSMTMDKTALPGSRIK